MNDIKQTGITHLENICFSLKYIKNKRNKGYKCPGHEENSSKLVSKEGANALRGVGEKNKKLKIKKSNPLTSVSR